MSGEAVVVQADLCHKGNYENIVGQPDMVHMSPPIRSRVRHPGLPDLVWFTCAAEANGINMFPCTGSRHIDANTVVECTCRCHVLRART